LFKFRKLRLKVA